MSSIQKGSRYITDILGYSKELVEKEDYSNLRFRDIAGFDPPKGTSAFLPYVKCVPIAALLPLYDTLVIGIPKIERINQMKDHTGLTFEDIVTLAHKGKLMLSVNVDCIGCLEQMSEVIQQFVDNDVSLLLGSWQGILLALKTAEPLGVDVDGGKELLHQFCATIDPVGKHLYSPHLNPCSMIKPTAEYIRQLIEVSRSGQPKEYVEALGDQLYMIPKLLLAKAFNSILSTNVGCRYIGGVERNLEDLTGGAKSIEQVDPYNLEFIERRLHIAYSEHIPFAEYSELFDSETTESMRKIIRGIIAHDHSKGRFDVTLLNSLEEYNKQVEELISRATTRTKLVYATSDILKSNAGAIKLLMEGIAEKYLNAPQRAWDCFVVPKRYRSGISKWLSEKVVDLESKLAGVSPDIIHLYRVRTCVEKLKQKS
jgi:hypothetical protein